MSIMEFKKDYLFTRILKSLFKHFSLSQTRYSITPLLQYTSQDHLQGLSDIKQLLITNFQNDCPGVEHAAI